MDEYVSANVGTPFPLLDDAATKLVEQYLTHFSLYPKNNEPVEWDLFFSTKTAAINLPDGKVRLRFEQLPNGKLTAKVFRGQKMRFKSVDYRNSAAGNGSELVDLW
jgi:hypothetical protein